MPSHRRYAREFYQLLSTPIGSRLCGRAPNMKETNKIHLAKSLIPFPRSVFQFPPKTNDVQ